MRCGRAGRRGIALILVLFPGGVASATDEDHQAALEKLGTIPPGQIGFVPAKEHPVCAVEVTADGVSITGVSAPVPYDYVLEALAALPLKSWTYGRTIVFWENPPSLSLRKDWPKPADAKGVKALLDLAHFTYYPMKSR